MIANPDTIEDWKTYKIKDFGNVLTGTTPSTKNESYYGGEYKLISPADLNNSKYISSAHKIITKEGLGVSRTVPRNSVLVGCIGNVGKIGMTIDEVSAFNQQINAIVCNDNFDANFVYYLLRYNSPLLESKATKVTVPILNKNNFENIELKAPKLLEQKSIAHVLTTIQDAIAGQEELITKLKELKKSMMQHLFTRGTKGEKTKMTEIGEIPESWEVEEIGKVFEFTKKSRKFKLQGMVPFIPMENIPIGSIFVSDFVEKKAEKISSGTYVENGDLLLAKITPSFENGKQAILKIDNSYAYATTEVIPVKGIENKSFIIFLFYYLLKDDIRQHLAGKMEGTTGRQRLSKTVLEKTYIPFPDYNEQEKIANTFIAIDKKIEAIQEKLSNYQNLFKTLLHELMSGGMPVDKNIAICNNKRTEFQKKFKKLSEVEKTGKNNKEGKQTLKEHHQRLQGSTTKLTKEEKDDTLKVEVDGLKFSSSSASSFRGTIEPNLYNVTGNFSCDFFILKKEIEQAFKKIKKGSKNKKDPQFQRFNFIPENIDEEKFHENSLSKFKKNGSENIEKICKDILNEEYKIDHYFGFLKSRGKDKLPRPILSPSIKDKIVFTWILEKIKHNFDFLNEYNIYGSYPNRRRISEILKDILDISQKYKYILKIDIENFYPSIKRDLLFQNLERDNRIVKDKFFIEVIKKAIENKINFKKKKEERFFPKTGIPQGCAFSPLLANYYAFLKLDKFLKDKKLISFRYLDDLIVFVKNEAEAKRIFFELENRAKKIGLKIHPLHNGGNKSYIASSSKPFEYLGVKIENCKFNIPEKKINQVCEMVRSGILNKGIARKFKKEEILKRLENYILGWKTYYKSTCEDHFNEIRVDINKNLKKYYRKFSEIIDISSEKYYL